MIPTIKTLYDRCTEEGECRIWAQCVNGAGLPIMSLSAKQRGKSVRRIAWEACRGPIPPKMFIYPTCGNQKCIRCLACGTRSDYMLEASRLGLLSGPAICAARTRAARARSSTSNTIEKAREVRRARQSGARLSDIAAEHGISIGMASKIALGLIWREASQNSSVFNQAA